MVVLTLDYLHCLLTVLFALSSSVFGANKHIKNAHQMFQELIYYHIWSLLQDFTPSQFIFNIMLTRHQLPDLVLNKVNIYGQ